VARALFVAARHLSLPDEITGVTPVMVAIETENVACITELIIRGARLDLVDKNGCTVFHYAAKTSNEIIIQVRSVVVS